MNLAHHFQESSRFESNFKFAGELMFSNRIMRDGKPAYQFWKDK
jgi:hypothetical protein